MERKECTGLETYLWHEGALVRLSDLHNLMPESALEEWKRSAPITKRRAPCVSSATHDGDSHA